MNKIKVVFIVGYSMTLQSGEYLFHVTVASRKKAPVEISGVVSGESEK